MVALLSIFKTLRFHPTLHGRVAGCFGTGASTERLVPLVGYLGLIGSRPQLQPVGPAPSHTLCFDFGWHAPSLALGCDENVALSPWHFAAEASVQRARSGGLSSGLQSRRSRFCHPLLQSGHLPANPQTKPAPDNTAITDASAKMGKDEGTHTGQHGAKSESDTKKVEQPNAEISRAILSKLRVNKIGPLEKILADH